MTPRNSFRIFQNDDLVSIWEELRPEDRQELHTVGFTSPQHLIAQLNQIDFKAITWTTERGPVAVMGVTPYREAGLVWALGTPEAEARWRFAVRNTEAVLSFLGQGFKVLANFKDSRNLKQIKWLRKLGFVFIAKHDAGAAQHLEFLRIVK